MKLAIACAVCLILAVMSGCSQEPVGAEAGLAALTGTLNGPDGQPGPSFHTYDGAWRRKDGEVRAEYHTVWTNPHTGEEIGEEKPDGWSVLRLKGEEVKLFCGEDKYPGRNAFIKDGMLYLRTTERRADK